MAEPFRTHGYRQRGDRGQDRYHVHDDLRPSHEHTRHSGPQWESPHPYEPEWDMRVDGDLIFHGQVYERRPTVDPEERTRQATMYHGAHPGYDTGDSREPAYGPVPMEHRVNSIYNQLKPGGVAEENVQGHDPSRYNRGASVDQEPVYRRPKVNIEPNLVPYVNLPPYHYYPSAHTTARESISKSQQPYPTNPLYETATDWPGQTRNESKIPAPGLQRVSRYPRPADSNAQPTRDAACQTAPNTLVTKQSQLPRPEREIRVLENEPPFSVNVHTYGYAAYGNAATSANVPTAEPPTPTSATVRERTHHPEGRRQRDTEYDDKPRRRRHSVNTRKPQKGERCIHQ